MIGQFRGIFKIMPPGSLRMILIDKKRFYVDFEKGYDQTKGINVGDRVKIDYKNENNFDIKKI